MTYWVALLLLLPSFNGKQMVVVGENSIGDGVCNKGDIVLYQRQSAPLPSGIPTYTVQILNTCISGCVPVSNIHVSCGWFSSARMINPNVFRRVAYDDCLANDGAQLAPGQMLSFQYANTNPYPLSIVSVECS